MNTITIQSVDTQGNVTVALPSPTPIVLTPQQIAEKINVCESEIAVLTTQLKNAQGQLETYQNAKTQSDAAITATPVNKITPPQQITP